MPAIAFTRMFTGGMIDSEGPYGMYLTVLCVLLWSAASWCLGCYFWYRWILPRMARNYYEEHRRHFFLFHY
ncbi:hypothetical protein PROFUN_14233 [Planoprotostelium fungivorum]|uniref:Uncharacterized protein n=1 Tax=Planoprotostelium fungivorum TaxID=1890364 RepID=A0A2P6N0R6_9EUKA|nr:hypothetical protein PROFUN_14233 [Planoprotostelium fungivorum]